MLRDRLAATFHELGREMAFDERHECCELCGSDLQRRLHSLGVPRAVLKESFGADDPNCRSNSSR